MKKLKIHVISIFMKIYENALEGEMSWKKRLDVLFVVENI